MHCMCVLQLFFHFHAHLIIYIETCDTNSTLICMINLACIHSLLSFSGKLMRFLVGSPQAPAHVLTSLGIVSMHVDTSIG